MVKTVRDVLVEARALLFKGWIKGNWAVDRRGLIVSDCSPKAVCFCPLGAINRVAPHCWLAQEAKSLIRAEVGDVIEWNDRLQTTQKDVLDVFDRVIARVK